MTKTYTILLFSLILFSCNSPQTEILEIPWFISQRVTDEGVKFYNYPDSLKKYETYNQAQVENQSTYLNYLANLNYKANQTEKLKIKNLIEASFQSDSIAFCEDFIKQTFDYLKPNNRPHRRYSMPYILDFDLEYFFELMDVCSTCCQPTIWGEFDSIAYKKLALSISYISLRDQWYRIPSREKNPTVQIEFDIWNRAFLDKLFTQYDLPKEDSDIRSTIFTLILHSVDCDWTEKWIQIYMDNYRGYKRYESNLKHFLRRSICTNEMYVKMIEEELENFKNKIN